MMNSEKIKKLGFEFEEQTGFDKTYFIFWNDEVIGFYVEGKDIMTITHDDCPKVYTCDMKNFEEWCAQEFVDLINEKKKKDGCKIIIQGEANE